MRDVPAYSNFESGEYFSLDSFGTGCEFGAGCAFEDCRFRYARTESDCQFSRCRFEVFPDVGDGCTFHDCEVGGAKLLDVSVFSVSFGSFKTYVFMTDAGLRVKAGTESISAESYTSALPAYTCLMNLNARKAIVELYYLTKNTWSNT